MRPLPLVAATLGATTVALIGGAWLAAPAEVSALAAHYGSRALVEVAALNDGVAARLGTSWQTAIRPWITARTPRDWAMIAAAVGTLGFGVAALRSGRAGVSRGRDTRSRATRDRARASTAMRATAAARDLPPASLAAAGRDRALPSAMAPLRGLAAARRPEQGRTPRDVVALADAGRTPDEIARRTGLSRDAVTLCLAMAPSHRPPATASA